MKCDTSRKGEECIFSKKSGCGYPTGCSIVTPECEVANKGTACSYIRREDRLCSLYPDPSGKWKSGGCPFRVNEMVDGIKTKVNPLKASKRAAGKK